MGTNYYLRFKPADESISKLKELIDQNEGQKIQDMVYDMYGNVHFDHEGKTLKGGVVHLGKRSGGWKFLWNPNMHLYDGKIYYLYFLTKNDIKAYIDRHDCELYDEYGEKQDKDEFWNMALNWNGHDYETYCKVNNEDSDYVMPVNNYKKQLWASMNIYTNEHGEDFYCDGLRFSTATEFS